MSSEIRQKKLSWKEGTMLTAGRRTGPEEQESHNVRILHGSLQSACTMHNTFEDSEWPKTENWNPGQLITSRGLSTRHNSKQNTFMGQRCCQRSSRVAFRSLSLRPCLTQSDRVVACSASPGHPSGRSMLAPTGTTVWTSEIHCVFCLVLPVIFVEEIERGLSHIHLLKFHFLQWLYGKQKYITDAVYSSKLFVDLKFHQLFWRYFYLHKKMHNMKNQKRKTELNQKKSKKSLAKKKEREKVEKVSDGNKKQVFWV